MVASDTVVGLVGAGILLVALVGVFVIESEDLSSDYAFEASFSLVSVTGNVASSGPQNLGGQDPISQCPDQLEEQDLCGPAVTEIDVTLSNAPVLGPDLFYVAFLTGGSGSPYAIGAMTRSDDTYRITASDNQDRSQYTTLVITLETMGTASSPMGPRIYENQYGPPSGTDAAPVTGQNNVTMAAGNVTAELSAAANGVQVDVLIEDATNYTGFQYRAWLIDDDGERGTVYVGNFTNTHEDDAAFSGEIAIGIRDVSRDDFERLIVTLESPASSEGEDAMPGGFPVWHVSL